MAWPGLAHPRQGTGDREAWARRRAATEDAWPEYEEHTRQRVLVSRPKYQQDPTLGGRSVCGRHDIALRTSRDGGATWSTLTPNAGWSARCCHAAAERSHACRTNRRIPSAPPAALSPYPTRQGSWKEPIVKTRT